MRILFVNSARSWGGNEKWTHLAAHALSNGHDVFLAYRDKAVGNRFGIPTFRLPFASELDPVTIGGLVRIIRREGIDVLIPTKRKDYVVAGIAARIGGCANVLRLGIVRKPRGAFARLVYDRWADGIIVNAERVRETLLDSKIITPEAVRVIYNGLDLEALDGASRLESAEKPYGFTILSSGRLIPRKRFDVLLEGFARFAADGVAGDAGLVVLGEGEEMELLKSQADALDISDRVRFEGFLKNPYPTMAVSDVFVSMSENEGVSNAMIEAMALGKPVIATRAGGTAEAIADGRNGFLLDTPDAGALAARLKRLHGDRSALNKMGEDARETAESMFSVERMVWEMEGFLTERLERQ